MFFDADIRANLLPRRTLCLTFDDGPGESDGDGPGPHTWALGRYLHAEGIRAAFFVIGRHAGRFPETLAALRDWGHLIGNHSHDHRGLVALASSGGDLVGEVERAQTILRAVGGASTVFLRPPFGHWRESIPPDHLRRRPDSLVARRLNASGRLHDLVGPVGWDIDAEDWNCWRYGAPLDFAVSHHLGQIERVGRGVVLMHDSSQDGFVRARNRTFRLAELLVPELKRRGYRFVGLDEVPQVRTATLVRDQVDLFAPDGLSVRLGIIPIRNGLVALRAGNGGLVTAPTAGGAVTARAFEAGPEQSFAIEPRADGAVVIRSLTGAVLTLQGTGTACRLLATRGTRDPGRLCVDSVHREGVVQGASGNNQTSAT